jgi:hypothetical protein
MSYRKPLTESFSNEPSYMVFTVARMSSVDFNDIDQALDALETIPQPTFEDTPTLFQWLKKALSPAKLQRQELDLQANGERALELGSREGTATPPNPKETLFSEELPQTSTQNIPQSVEVELASNGENTRTQIYRQTISYPEAKGDIILGGTATDIYTEHPSKSGTRACK